MFERLTTWSGGLSPVRGREAPCTPGLKLALSADPGKSSSASQQDPRIVDVGVSALVGVGVRLTTTNEPHAAAP
jgi:hypothetical protein